MSTMAAAIRFTVVWPIMAGNLRKIGKKTNCIILLFYKSYAISIRVCKVKFFPVRHIP